MAALQSSLGIFFSVQISAFSSTFTMLPLRQSVFSLFQEIHKLSISLSCPFQRGNIFNQKHFLECISCVFLVSMDLG